MYSRILVPLDGSKLAEKALPHAQGLAKTSGATIHLISVFSRNPSGGMALTGGLDSDPSTADLARQLEEAQLSGVEEYLERVAAQLEHDGIQSEREVCEGSAHDHIIDYAKQHGIDLIVMSTHGHGGLKRMLLGSNTDRVIRTGDVPVLVIP
ncbi:MAG: universal stress protein [Chloroflexi bacterium]|nr:universal stress protein [Chloroflexota bacterium]MDA1226608.1 universal stress protein [Chloroflexota bacterium]